MYIYKYTIMHIDIIEAYTDGSCIKNTKQTFCGYGVHFVRDEIGDISKNFKYLPLTNQRAELYAIYSAIRKVHKNYTFNSLIIYSDSEYSIKSLTIWINNWKQNGWMTKANKEVLNQDLIKKIDKYLQLYENKISFVHVKAHTNKMDEKSINNNIADKLAKQGALLNN
jgi:ribonuclease HI